MAKLQVSKNKKAMTGMAFFERIKI